MRSWWGLRNERFTNTKVSSSSLYCLISIMMSHVKSGHSFESSSCALAGRIPVPALKGGKSKIKGTQRNQAERGRHNGLRDEGSEER